ncbi:glycosyltransferase [Halobium salinum]|uniref:Glycosyltransferase n=1 Tax=Halobium salinum TaxID=1364940 RepID=A0ABD5PA18_9EURY|nr:glycosyltransferase [Halobium salinum]
MGETVGHFRTSFLPLTQTFIYQYLTHHERYEPFVCALSSENRDVFDFEPREVFLDLPRWSPRFWVYGSLAKLGIRGIENTYYQRILDRRDPDIVHAHFGPMGVKLVPHRTNDRQLVTSFYGYDASQLVDSNPEYRTKYEELFDHGDLFLVEGPAMREKVVALGCPKSKLAIQRIAIDTTRIEPRFPQDDGPMQVLMVGRFVEKKGMPDGIKAFASVFEGKAAELRIVGGEADEYTREDLGRVAADCNVENQVTFTGFLEYDQYLREVRTCDVLLAPSKRAESGDSEGGAPTVLLEAQASGKPVVATTHADIPYVIEDGKTGVLAAPGDISGLAAALERCVNDRERMARMGQVGVERMEQRHDVRVLAEQLEERYDGIR